MQKDETKKTKSALKAFYLTWAAVLLICTIYVFATRSQTTMGTLSLDGNVVNIEIAKTSQEKSKGLCCRQSLPASSGMLFIYDRPGNYHFWMKDTLISLDMLWIDSGKKVVYIERGVSPNSYPHTFTSPIPAQYILELNGGYTAKNNIKVGDQLSF